MTINITALFSWESVVGRVCQRLRCDFWKRPFKSRLRTEPVDRCHVPGENAIRLLLQAAGGRSSFAVLEAGRGLIAGVAPRMINGGLCVMIGYQLGCKFNEMDAICGPLVSIVACVILALMVQATAHRQSVLCHSLECCMRQSQVDATGLQSLSNEDSSRTRSAVNCVC